MLDRGQTEDWFDSTEIVAKAVLAGLGFYLFLVHMFTAQKPFIPPAMFKDRNFTGGLVMMLFTMAILLSSSALLAPYLQRLSGYPVADTGLLLAPRGMGTVCAMLIAGRLGTRVDQRYMVGFGLCSAGPCATACGEAAGRNWSRSPPPMSGSIPASTVLRNKWSSRARGRGLHCAPHGAGIPAGS